MGTDSPVARRVLRRPRRRREGVRFRQLVQVFLDEVRITGIRTDVDDTVRVLVAASAAIPIFGFHDWEYHRLGEVLVYPASFGDAYQTKGEANENTLGMVGLRHLSGVMILSKPALLAGFENRSSKENVGVHEFAHLVEEEEAVHGLPPEVPPEVVQQWIQYVARELRILPRIEPTSMITLIRMSRNTLRYWRSISSSRRTYYEKKTPNCIKCCERCFIKTRGVCPN